MQDKFYMNQMKPRGIFGAIPEGSRGPIFEEILIQA